MPRKRINDGSLPKICVVCGENATHVGFPGVGAPSLAWLLVSPLIGLLGFWGYIAFGGGRNHDQRAGFPFCDRHRKYWPRRARFIIGGFLVLVVLMGVGFALTPGAFSAKKPEPHWLLGVAGCLDDHLPANFHRRAFDGGQADGECQQVGHVFVGEQEVRGSAQGRSLQA